MAKARDPGFTRELGRMIEPTGGPGVELATLADAARFVGNMRPFRRAWPWWDFAAESVLNCRDRG